MTRRPNHAVHALREVLNGAVIRTLAGIQDAGEVFLARIANIDGGLHYDTTGDADIWVNYIDELTGMPGQARLHIPCGILFGLPEAEDTCTILRPRDLNAPGVAYALHGDGGIADRFPSWVDTAVGIFTKKILNLQSSEEDVKVDCGSGKAIKLGFSASKGVARQDDHVDCGTLAVAMAGPSPQFTYTPPFGPQQIGASVNLVGKVSTSSAKVKAED
jgi:hypothetical protein